MVGRFECFGYCNLSEDNLGIGEGQIVDECGSKSCLVSFWIRVAHV
jgi:hypothetical protein